MQLTKMTASRRRRLPVKIMALGCLLLGVIRPPDAAADMVMVSDTSLVSGSQASVFSFDAPGPGTVTVQMSNLAWPDPLSSLSFTATTANKVLSAWDVSGTQSESFQVSGGSYFAHIAAPAQGPLDLGLYSLSLKFIPAGAPVPLPASGWLLAAGILFLMLTGLFRATSGQLTISAPQHGTSP